MRLPTPVAVLKAAWNLTATLVRRSQFSMERFVALALRQDLALLRATYKGHIPATITATEAVACLELNGLMDKLVRKGWPKLGSEYDGLFLLGSDGDYEVVVVNSGRFASADKFSDLVDACAHYFDLLLIDLRSPAAASTRLPVAKSTTAAMPRRLQPVPAVGRSSSNVAAQRQGNSAQRQGNSTPARRHLSLVQSSTIVL